MKKYLIIILSIVILVSFSSCEKDKSGDVISAYSRFCDSYRHVDYAESVLSSSISATNQIVDVSLSTLTTPATTDIHTFFEEFYNSEVPEGYKLNSEAMTITARDGKITGTCHDAYTYDLTYDGVKIDYKYKFKNEETNEYSEEYTKSFTISGTVTSTKTGDTVTYSSNVTIDGIAYKCSFTGSFSTNEFTSAKVGDEDVNLKLLNAAGLEW